MHFNCLKLPYEIKTEKIAASTIKLNNLGILLLTLKLNLSYRI
jgi:hypothetical protein